MLSFEYWWHGAFSSSWLYQHRHYESVLFFGINISQKCSWLFDWCWELIFQIQLLAGRFVWMDAQFHDFLMPGMICHAPQQWEYFLIIMLSMHRWLIRCKPFECISSSQLIQYIHSYLKQTKAIFTVLASCRSFRLNLIISKNSSRS